MKIVITGAAGFIGSHLTEHLLAKGHSITGIDNFDDFYNPDVKRDNIKTALQNDNFKIIQADIRNGEIMDTILADGADAVVHLAARAGVRPSIENPKLYTDVNVNGTVVMLEAAKKHNIQKFILGSSSSVYGNNKKIPFSEKDNVDFPISPYAATKKAGELICHTYHHLYNIHITTLRFFTVYGPRQRPDLAIHKFARLIELNKPVPIYGDGTMQRDFTYIDDIIQGTTAAIENCRGCEIYNLGESTPISVNNLISELEKALGKNAKRRYLPLQPGDVERTYADISKAEKLLGYQPNTSFEKGLEVFVKWLRR